jgi:hypothetical protein
MWKLPARIRPLVRDPRQWRARLNHVRCVVTRDHVEVLMPANKVKMVNMTDEVFIFGGELPISQISPIEFQMRVKF